MDGDGSSGSSGSDGRNEAATDKPKNEESTTSDSSGNRREGGNGNSQEENGSSHKDSESSIVGYKSSETSGKNTMDSGYRSMAASTSGGYKTSHTSSHSKSNSSISGSSGFASYKPGVKVEEGHKAATPIKKEHSLTLPAMPQIHKKDRTPHKKIKGKSTDRAKEGQVAGGPSPSSAAGESGPGSSKKIDPKPSTSGISTQGDKAAKVAALTQALNFIDKFKRSQEEKEDKHDGPNASEINDLATNLQEASQGASTAKGKLFPFTTCIGANEQISNVLNKAEGDRDGEGFCAAVSLNDGRVICTTASIKATLGYPKDMWVARSFIDFVHPKDRLTFTNQITRGVTNPFKNHLKSHGSPRGGDKSATDDNFFYCRLRVYHGLKQGKYSVKNRKTTYSPFHMEVRFKEIDAPQTIGKSSPAKNPSDDGASIENQGRESDVISSTSESQRCDLRSVCLVVTSVPIKSAYSQPNQDGPFTKDTFVTRHLASCAYSMIEDAAIPFLGYLPQDMEGSDVFSYYHPKDLPYLKKVYQTVMLEQGKPFRSRPYRFKVRSGDYILLETDWSCFINPWSKKLEFVIGKHTVLKGPSKTDVFGVNDEEGDPMESVEEVPQETKAIQNEIRLMLTETIRRPVAANNILLGRVASRKRQELASFMGSLLEEMAKAETSHEISESNSFFGTVGTGTGTGQGDISPRAPMSSDSPPSYNQLNYNDNLARFFNSQPKTLTHKEAEVDAMADEADFVGRLDNISKSNQLEVSSSSRTKSGSAPPFDGDRSNTNSESTSVALKKDPRQDLENVRKNKAKATVEDVGIPAEESGSGSREKRPNHEEESGDSGEMGVGTTVGTSGGVSAVHNTRHKRLVSHTPGQNKGAGDGGSGSGCEGFSGTGSGGKDGNGSGSGSGQRSSHYKPPLLTEKLLHVHNRGMEQRMIEQYKDTKKGELVFIKNKPRGQGGKGQHRRGTNYHAHHQQHWPTQERGDSGRQGRNAPGQRLWPKPGHLGTTQDAIQGQQPQISIQGSHLLSTIQPGPSGVQVAPSPVVVNPPPETGGSSSSETLAPLYANIIPAYFIPADSNFSSRGPAFLVANPTNPHGQPSFVQSAGPLLPQGTTPAMIYHPVAQSSRPMDPSLRPGPNMTPRQESKRSNVRSVAATPRGSSQDLHMTASVENCPSGSVLDRETPKSSKSKRTKGIQPFKFQEPSATRNIVSPGSRATSVKAEPGSALESNLESNASLTASVLEKLLFPGIHRFPRSRHAVTEDEGDNLSSDGSTSSSLYSLLKSSDDFGPTGESSNTSDEEAKYHSVLPPPPKPILKDPMWMQNVRVTPKMVFDYKVKTRPMKEVLNADLDRLKKMYQPKLVNQQLSQYLTECEEQGLNARPLLDEETSSSSLSSGDGTPTTLSGDQKMETEAREERYKKKSRKQVLFDMYAVTYEVDAPFPPSSHSPKQAGSATKSSEKLIGKRSSVPDKACESVETAVSSDSSKEDKSCTHRSSRSEMSSALGSEDTSEEGKMITGDSKDSSKDKNGSSRFSPEGDSKTSTDEGIGSKEHSDCKVNDGGKGKVQLLGLNLRLPYLAC